MGQMELFLALFMAKQAPASAPSSSVGASVTQVTTSKGERTLQAGADW